MAGKKVLVVDDEKLIVKGIRFSLEQDNMEVDCAYDGEEALQMAHNKEYDIILLDVMLPKLTGFEVCQQIREFSNVPVIMLTAKGDDMDKILGLEYGADDYITKPFNILEVKARIKAIFRRMEPKKGTAENTVILESGDLKLDREGRRAYIQGREIGLTAKEFEVLELLVRIEKVLARTKPEEHTLSVLNLEINFEQHTVRQDGKEVSLKPMEFELLAVLARNKNRAISRENLLRMVWGVEYMGETRTVDVHIGQLRKKLNLAEHIKTVSKLGYRLEE